MSAAEQTSLWDHERRKKEILHDAINGVGPFPADPQGSHHRYFSCANYDRCLSFASGKMWPYFTCFGCRKTVGKKER